MVHEYSCIFSLSQPDETWRSISSSLTMSIMTSSIASFSVFPRSGFGGPIDLGFPESTDPSPVHIYKDGHQNSKDWDDDHANSYRQDSIVVVVSGIKRYQSTLMQRRRKLRIWIFEIHENCICCKLGHLMQVFCFVSNTIWIPLMKNHLWLLFCLLNIFFQWVGGGGGGVKA